MQNSLFIILAWITFILGSFSSYAQEVSISAEMNIRNYYAYELLGKIDERFIVYRDKGFIKEVDVFNEFMEHTLHAELDLEKKRTDVVNTLGMDTVFQMVYGYLERDTVILKMRRYNKNISIVDSSTLISIPKKNIKSRIEGVLSEDKSKLLVYTIDAEDNMILLLYDNEKNRILQTQLIQFPKEIKIKKILRKAILTNKGTLVMGLYENEFYNDGGDAKMQIMSYNILQNYSEVSVVDFGERQKRDIFMDYDNQNEKIIVAGLYGDKKARESKGIYLFIGSITSGGLDQPIRFIPFSDKLIDEVSRTKKKKSKVFENFEVREVIKRQDGGVVVLMELAREFSRRNSSSGDYRSWGGGIRRGWVDYYNEDIIVSSISPDAKVEWSKILYKKQFSQDDEAIYSSFFIMKTPSRMRLIYNDEIKKNSTVSEYILDPTGKVARNSLLSTEDQSLKLRFRDGVQLSNRELIVPSENNFELNLVKISY